MELLALILFALPTSSADAVNVLSTTITNAFLITQLRQYINQTDLQNLALGVMQTPPVSTDQLTLIKRFTSVHAPGIDLTLLDNVWPGDLASSLLDLRPYLTETDLADFDLSSLNVCNVNGKLVCIPGYLDFGYLLYRKDLLEEYYGVNATPPEDWDTLEQMAEYVQSQERAKGNSNFWGYVFPAAANEGLTCIALELINSHGGGTILDWNTKQVTVNNPYTRKALLRMASWIGKISPLTVPTLTSPASEKIWLSGNALFHRQWTYGIPDSNAAPAVFGKFGVALLPRDNSSVGKHTGTRGGWNYAVINYVKNAVPAAKIASFLETPKQQYDSFKVLGQYPTRTSVRQNSTLCSRKNASYVVLCDLDIPNDYIVPRPSSYSAPHYTAFSNVFYSQLSVAIKKGISESNVDAFLSSFECNLSATLYDPIHLPNRCVTIIPTSASALDFSYSVIAVGVFLNSCSGVFIWMYREHPAIKSSWTTFLLFVNVAVLCAFLELLLLSAGAASPVSFSWICGLTPFLGGLAFHLLLGAVTVKISLLHLTFHNQGKNTSDSKYIPRLVMAAAGVYLVDLLICSARMAITSPAMIKMVQSGTELVYKCSTDFDTAAYLLQCWRGLVLIASCLLCYLTKSVPNLWSEKKSLGFIVYNITFLALIYIVLWPYLQITTDLDLILQVLFTSATMFSVLALWMISKVWLVVTKSEDEFKLEMREAVHGFTGVPNGTKQSTDVLRSKKSGDRSSRIAVTPGGAVSSTSEKLDEDKKAKGSSEKNQTASTTGV